LRDVKSSCRSAKVQFTRYGQSEYQFLEWGSVAHSFTAKVN
jgi:hypothetical protein